MNPGDEDQSDAPSDPAVAAGESAPSSNGYAEPAELVAAPEEETQTDVAEKTKIDDDEATETVRVTSLADDDEDEPAEAPEGDEKPKAKPKRRRKKAEEAPGLPKVDEELMSWYVLKVQSNREDSISDAMKRRLKIAGLDPHVGEVVVPTEKVLEIKDGKKRVVKRKFYPGYIMLRMELTDDVWFIIRDTPGVGHFLGPTEKPLPMTASDIERMLGRTATAETEAAVKEAAPRPAIEFVKGDRVVIKEGPFENFEGDVEEVHEDKGTVRVMIQIFGRPTPVDVKYWEVGKVRM
jgi:transcriptional antiterminator NusG